MARLVKREESSEIYLLLYCPEHYDGQLDGNVEHNITCGVT